MILVGRKISELFSNIVNTYYEEVYFCNDGENEKNYYLIESKKIQVLIEKYNNYASNNGLELISNREADVFLENVDNINDHALSAYLNTHNLNNKDTIKLKKAICKADYLDEDLKDFVGTKLYDNIWLSNVGQYLKNHELYDIVYKLSKILDIDGQILVCYLYDFTYDTKYYDEWAEIYDLISLKMIFKEIPLNVNSFIGLTGIIHNRNDKDSVLIYKKVR